MNMYPSLLITGIIGISVGLGFIIWGIWIRWSAQKYEFNNITDGGVVRFESFWATKRHALKKILSRLFLFIGFVVLVFGVSVFVGSQMLKNQQRTATRTSDR